MELPMLDAEVQRSLALLKDQLQEMRAEMTDLKELLAQIPDAAGQCQGLEHILANFVVPGLADLDVLATTPMEPAEFRQTLDRILQPLRLARFDMRVLAGKDMGKPS